MIDEPLFAQMQLFAALPRDELARLGGVLRQISLAPGTVLFREGEYGDRCYIVLDGQVALIKEHEPDEGRLLAVRLPGELFGEGSLLNADHLRTASARAMTHTLLLEISRADFDALLRQHSSFAYELIRQMSMYLRESSDSRYRELEEKNQQIIRAYQELQAAQAKLIEKEKLEHELQMAREMQDLSLPRHLPNLPGFAFGMRLVPAWLVSGDFFDFITLDADHLGVVVGDVCGKGVPAAFFTAQTRSLLRAEAKRAMSPRAVLQCVNQHLLDMNDTGMFVTMVYGVLHRVTREFVYVRAGHELPMVIDEYGITTLIGHGGGQPLGVLPDPLLEERGVMLAPGKTLLIYTDGVTEAMDVRGSFFGMTLLRSTVSIPQPSPQALCDHILDTVATYHGDAPQDDDVTLVAVRAV